MTMTDNPIMIDKSTMIMTNKSTMTDNPIMTMIDNQTITDNPIMIDESTMTMIIIDNPITIDKSTMTIDKDELNIFLHAVIMLAIHHLEVIGVKNMILILLLMIKNVKTIINIRKL